MLRQNRERREHGDRLDAGNGGAALPDVEIVRAEGHQTVREENHVEPPAFRNPGDFRVMGHGLGGAIGCGGMTPRGDVMAASLNEKTQLHHRRVLPLQPYYRPGGR